MADLPRLPMAAKTDLWAAYPLGCWGFRAEAGHVCMVPAAPAAGPTLVGYTRADLALWARMCARALAAAGAARASAIHNAYGYGLFTGGLGIHQGAIELGAAVVPVSGGMTSRQVTLIRDLRPDILTCTPSYAIRLGEALAAAGAGPGEGLTLKAGLFGAEPWTGQMRARIEELLGAAGPGHLRVVRGDRARGGRRVPGGGGRPARQRGPLPGRGGGPGDRRAGARRAPRGSWCSAA